MQEDLRYKSYSLQRGQFVSETAKAWQDEKAGKLLTMLKHPTITNQLIFLDEQNFTLDQKVNRKKSWWLFLYPTES
jgi:hypothetical protein